MIDWTDITTYGDVTITSVAAAAIAAWLFVEDEKRLALLWSVLFAAGMGLVVASKMAFIGWGLGIRSIDFAGFSGHAMRVSAVMPVLLYLILQRASFPVRSGAVVAGMVFAAMVGVSRVVLHTHSVSEVVAGMLLGGGIALVFISVAHASLSKHVFKPLRIVLSVLALLPAPYVHPAPTQKWLTEITMYFSGHDHPFMRAEWREENRHRPPEAY